MIQIKPLSYLPDGKEAPGRRVCAKVIQVAEKGRQNNWSYWNNQAVISPRQQGEHQNADMGFNSLQFKRWQYESTSLYGLWIWFHSFDKFASLK